jgi:hypothetical protein
MPRRHRQDNIWPLCLKEWREIYYMYKTAGTDVMILKIFSPKKLAKKLAFLTQSKAKI